MLKQNYATCGSRLLDFIFTHNGKTQGKCYGLIVPRHDDDVTSRTIDLPACSRDANNLGGRAINGREWRLR